MPSPALFVGTRDAAGWITIANPARRNAMTQAMLVDLARHLERLEADDAVRVIVLRGAGEAAFVAGADFRDTATTHDALDVVVDRLSTMGKPVLAMVQGHCIGLGVNLALCCDIRIAGAGAKFSIPASRIGNGYRWRSTRRLMDIVGPAFAREILLTGRPFDAEEARAMGLVNRVVADAEIEGYTRSYCAMIAANAPLSMRAHKGTIDALLQSAPLPDMERCDVLYRACAESDDYRVGKEALRGRLKPQFRGR